METKEQFYHLDLSLDGEPQGVGILAGIGELDFSEEMEELLLRDFEHNLPIPILPQRGTEDGMLSYISQKWG